MVYMLIYRQVGLIKAKATQSQAQVSKILTPLLLSTTCIVLANSVDPDQLASEEAN